MQTGRWKLGLYLLYQGVQGGAAATLHNQVMVWGQGVGQGAANTASGTSNEGDGPRGR